MRQINFPKPNETTMERIHREKMERAMTEGERIEVLKDTIKDKVKFIIVMSVVIVGGLGLYAMFAPIHP